jgi:DNA adenine methylase
MGRAATAAIPGSKAGAGVAQRIVSLLPPHELYIEAFAGGAAVGRLKRPSGCDVFVERDVARASSLMTMLPASAHLVVGDVMQVIAPERVPAEAVVYCDPPYLMSTRRSSRRYYRHELASEDEHTRFLEWARRLPCRVLISGYASALYSSTLTDWRTVEFSAQTRGGGAAVETVWCNFPEPAELHDTRFVGDGFRDRERIRRKVSRWVNRLKRLPLAERAVILAAFDDEGLPRETGLHRQK